MRSSAFEIPTTLTREPGSTKKIEQVEREEQQIVLEHSNNRKPNYGLVVIPHSVVCRRDRTRSTYLD